MTHGAGAIIDLGEGKSAVVMSPDYWRRYGTIQEPRLAKFLGVRYFRSPAEGWFMSDEGFTKSGVLVRRFPYLWYCPQCRRLQNGQYCNWCSNEEEKVELIPPRLIAACEGGHLQDFPWRYWVRCDNNNHVLELHPSKEESDLEIRCPKCMEEKKPTKDNPRPGIRNLAGALGKTKLSCRGERPWIGDKKAKEDCERKIHGMMRGGSNVYFPLIRSSILIPRYSWRIYQRIIEGRDLDYVKRTYDDFGEDSEMFRMVLENVITKYRPLYVDGEDSEYTVQDFKDAFIYHCKAPISKNIKMDEWNALKDPGSPPKKSDRLDFHPVNIDISENLYLKEYFDKLIVLKRLTEVISLCGFTRINPYEKETEWSYQNRKDPTISTIRENDEIKWKEIHDEMVEGDGATRRGYKYLVEFDSRTQRPKPDERDWLPAIKNKGEGIFFIFNKERLRRWEEDDEVKKWAYQIEKNGVQTLSIMEGFEFTPRGLLLHTFSHLLLKQIARECGYQLASLRERLYASKSDNTYGVLIYTSTPDSQGSLGGLTYQAEDLGILTEHIRSLIDSAKFCSQDPLCGQHNPKITKKPWGAACHSCLHVPETSCEALMNRFLDRYMIQGDGLKRKGYFLQV